MNEAGAYGARSYSDSVDWARYERIYNPVALSRRRLYAGIDGRQRITEVQGMITGRLASEVI
jgi:hypothetical protein